MSKPAFAWPEGRRVAVIIAVGDAEAWAEWRAILRVASAVIEAGCQLGALGRLKSQLPTHFVVTDL